ncbi:uncharacterized protein LTR77_005003 [Saxophila tyrrhenica]|uniref:Uncharacterized protein n=1 Tax=Saxophila tyrrhenica TaxID=1690608 RepID=A0AAV9PF28_9PEZI|nr:hypothetical protein LTR77_005003 [Saxophila tyrrhenica]
MSAAIKIASVASGLTLAGYSALHIARTPAQEFSKNSMAIDHTLQTQTSGVVPKPKLPSNFVSFTIGGYEFKNAA